MSHATCSFYDDVRIEITGKKFRIGEYHGEIRVDKLPTELPQFWIKVKYATEVDQADFPKSVYIEIPGRDKPETIDIQSQKLPEKPSDPDVQFYVAVIEIPLRPFLLAKEGVIKVYVQTESGKEYRAGRLKVVDGSIHDDNKGEAGIPLRALGPCVAYFDSLLSEGHAEDASEFAVKTLMLLREAMPHKMAKDILFSTQGRILITPQKVWVMFEEPQVTPPKVLLKMPKDAPKASIVGVDRFGFEIIFDEPIRDLSKIKYTIR